MGEGLPLGAREAEADDVLRVKMPSEVRYCYFYQLRGLGLMRKSERLTRRDVIRHIDYVKRLCHACV